MAPGDFSGSYFLGARAAPVCTELLTLYRLYKYTVVFQVYVYRIINFVSSVQVHSRVSSVCVQNY